MFFRLEKSGERSYVQIVENKRVDGAVRQSVMATLGRADKLAASGALASRAAILFPRRLSHIIVAHPSRL